MLSTSRAENSLNLKRDHFHWARMVIIFSISLLLALAVGWYTNTYERVNQQVCFTVDSPSSTTAQLYTAKNNDGFKEENSHSLAVLPGAQELCFSSSWGDKNLRWDPSRSQGSMQLLSAGVNIFGLDLKLETNEFKPENMTIDQVEENPSKKILTYSSSDPQLYFSVSDHLRALQFVYITALLTMLLLVAAFLVMSIFQKAVVDNNRSYQVALLSIVLLSIVWQVSGMIAVSNGEGWDGHAYLNLIIDWARSGVLPAQDPYRVSRLLGFPALILTDSVLSISRHQLVLLQVIVNVVGLGVSVGLFHSYLKKSGVVARTATQFSIVLLLAWPVLVMSTYYPMLSDHLAIILSCLSLWLAVGQYRKTLLSICIISPLIMPGLFLLPLTLLVFSCKGNENAWLLRFKLNAKVKIAVTILLSLFLLILAYHYSSNIPDAVLVTKTSNTTPALIGLRPLSTLYILTALLVIALLWYKNLADGVFLKKLSIKWSFLAISACLSGHAILYLSLDWNTGFRGPNLIENMFYQALNAPLKPLVSHFLYFGPAFIAALILMFKSKNNDDLHYPVKMAILGFLPILAIGSESRQWAALLPFLIAFVAQYGVKYKIRVLMIASSLVLAAPLFWLQSYTEKAITLNLPITDWYWQGYFGRQGPWMSQETYVIGALSALVFVILWAISSVRSRKHQKTE